MKDITTYINEAKSINWKKIAKSLSKEDKEWIQKYALDKNSNQIYTMEELEQRMWKGDLKDQWDKMNNYIVDNILTKENGITQRDVIREYSLATSGKQSMIEFVAQTIYMINIQLD